MWQRMQQLHLYPKMQNASDQLYVWEFLLDFFHKHRQVVDLVLVDANSSNTWHIGELDVTGVIVSIQYKSAELFYLAQQS